MVLKGDEGVFWVVWKIIRREQSAFHLGICILMGDDILRNSPFKD